MRRGEGRPIPRGPFTFEGTVFDGVCPACGAPTAADLRYCLSCGGRLGPDSTVAAQRVAAPRGTQPALRTIASTSRRTAALSLAPPASAARTLARHKRLVAGAMTIVIIAAPFLALDQSPLAFLPRAVSDADDAVMWGSIQLSVSSYIAEDLRHGTDGFPADGDLLGLADASLLHARIDAALAALALTVPSDGRRVLRLSVLPIYRELSDALARLIDAERTGDLTQSAVQRRTAAVLEARVAATLTMLEPPTTSLSPVGHLASLTMPVSAAATSCASPTSASFDDKTTYTGPVRALRLASPDYLTPGVALYGRADLDAKALETYDAARSSRIADLLKRQTIVEGQLSKARERLSRFDAGAGRQGLSALLSDLRDDRKEALREVGNGFVDVVRAVPFGELVADPLLKAATTRSQDAFNNAVDATLTGKDFSQRVAKGEQLKFDDWAKVANIVAGAGTVSYDVAVGLGAAKGLSKAATAWIAGAQIGFAALTLAGAAKYLRDADRAVDQVREGKVRADEALSNARRALSAAVTDLEAEQDQNAREIRALAADCTAVQSWRGALAPPLALSPAAPRGTVGKPYTYAAAPAASGGVPPYAFRVSVGNLPAGLSLDAATGTISGTPTKTTNSEVQLCVQDSVANETCHLAAVRVDPPPLVFNPPSPPDGKAGEGYPSFSFCQPAPRSTGIPCESPGLERSTVDPNGGQEPYTFSLGVGSLPSGLALNPNGTLSGTPRADGSYRFQVCAKDSAGENLCREVTLAVAPAPTAPPVVVALPVAPPVTGVPPSPTAGTPGTLAPTPTIDIKTARVEGTFTRVDAYQGTNYTLSYTFTPSCATGACTVTLVSQVFRDCVGYYDFCGFDTVTSQATFDGTTYRGQWSRSPRPCYKTSNSAFIGYGLSSTFSYEFRVTSATAGSSGARATQVSFSGTVRWSIVNSVCANTNLSDDSVTFTASRQ